MPATHASRNDCIPKALTHEYSLVEPRIIKVETRINAINNCIILDPKTTSAIFYPPFTIINATMARNESIRDIDSNSGNLNNLHFAVEVSTTAIDIPIIIIFITKINNAKTYSAASACLLYTSDAADDLL